MALQQVRKNNMKALMLFLLLPTIASAQSIDNYCKDRVCTFRDNALVVCPQLSRPAIEDDLNKCVQLDGHIVPALVWYNIEPTMNQPMGTFVPMNWPETSNIYQHDYSKCSRAEGSHTIICKAKEK
jgi:hypothetical protein